MRIVFLYAMLAAYGLYVSSITTKKQEVIYNAFASGVWTGSAIIELLKVIK